MSGTIEDIAKKWLAEPAYNKVFKHTFDVIEDYLCYFLTGIGSIALAVRFLTSLGSGEVVCAIKGVKHNTSQDEDLGPYPSGSTNQLVTYANHNKACSEAALTEFLQYLPFILLLQAVAIILVEKMLTKFPRISGKIERFYGAVVEDSLFGKDPDVAEDVLDNKANSEAISRQRQRTEICMTLKRSNIIHRMYIVKNIIEIVLLLIFIPVNIIYGLDAERSLESHLCIIDLSGVPQLDLDAGQVFFQCEGKKVLFFLRLLYVHVVTMFLVMGCSAGSIVWCLFLRSISSLLKKIKRSNIECNITLEPEQGKDFLFLFDLLSHSSGIESTLRVLTHADDNFRELCQPKVEEDKVKVEEDKLKVVWQPAILELWLEGHSHKGIHVDSYDVTIFPTETVDHTKTLVPKQKNTETGNYTAWFFDLEGGKTEYVITIACVIGKSRMKGERIVTTLLPYGAVKPRSGIVKSTGTDEVEISWQPPKGSFTKYVLLVDPNVNSTSSPKRDIGFDIKGIFSRMFNSGQESHQSNFSTNELDQICDGPTTRELSSLLTEHKVSGLTPGCTYGILLKTATGRRQTRQPVFECVMTKPLPVQSFSCSTTSTSSVDLKWCPPERHKRLKAFNIVIQSRDAKVKREVAVKHKPDLPLGNFSVTGIPPATEFTVTIISVCVFETLKTESDPESLIFQTCPEPPTNLTLENRYPNSFTVKWEPPSTINNTHRYRLAIDAPALSYTAEYFVAGDKTTFNFSKLPDIVGTGEKYGVQVEHLAVPFGSEVETCSAPLTGTFTTRPLAPTTFRVDEESAEVAWVASPSPSVSTYKVRWKSTEEGSKPEELLIPAPEDPNNCKLALKDLIPGIPYKVNIYAIVEDSGIPVESKELHDKVSPTGLPQRASLLDINPGPVESKPLHEKVILVDGVLMVYTEEMERAPSGASGVLSRQTSEK